MSVVGVITLSVGGSRQRVEVKDGQIFVSKMPTSDVAASQPSSLKSTVSNAATLSKCLVTGGIEANHEPAITVKRNLLRKVHQNVTDNGKMIRHTGCDKLSANMHRLDAHVANHTRPFRCSVSGCDEQFRTKCGLNKHTRSHNDSPTTHVFTQSNSTKVSTSDDSLHQHTVASMNKSFLCTECAHAFDTLSRLREHQRIHTGERPYACTMPGCSWSFRTSSKLSRHMQHHGPQKLWACPHEGCAKTFTRPEHARVHLSTHSDERRYTCYIDGCRARFKVPNSLRAHVKRHQLAMSPATRRVFAYCTHGTCTRKFSNEAALHTHIERVHGVVTAASVTGLTATTSLSPLDTRSAGSSSTPIINAATSARRRAVLDNHFIQRLDNSVSTTGSGVCRTERIPGPPQPRSPSILDKMRTKQYAVPIGSARTHFSASDVLGRKTRVVKQCTADTVPVQYGTSDIVLEVPYVTSVEQGDVTSMAMTFRDPDTGAVYVQTQLLQDDPPADMEAMTTYDWEVDISEQLVINLDPTNHVKTRPVHSGLLPDKTWINESGPDQYTVVYCLTRPGLMSLD